MKFCMFFSLPAIVGIPIPNQLPGLAVKERTLDPSCAVVAAGVRLLQISTVGVAPSEFVHHRGLRKYTELSGFAGKVHGLKRLRIGIPE